MRELLSPSPTFNPHTEAGEGRQKDWDFSWSPREVKSAVVRLVEAGSRPDIGHAHLPALRRGWGWGDSERELFFKAD